MALILRTVMKQDAKGLLDQRAAERWDENGTSAQVTMFLTDDTGIAQERIKELEYYLDEAMTENSIQEESTEESSSGGSVEDTESEKRLWTDAYSALGVITISNGSKSLTRNAVGVGGDFYLFHPVHMLTGQFLRREDTMTDRVVLDEDTAWNLFGSNDIIGQTINIGGVPHQIVGVYRQEDDKVAKAAGLSESYVFLSYESLWRYGNITGSGLITSSGTDNTTTNTSGAGSSTSSSSGTVGEVTGSADSDPAGIRCYEVVMPNPVDGFAAKIVTEKLTSVSSSQRIIVDNTARFGFTNLYDVLKNLGVRSMITKPIVYPYWENIARSHENKQAILMVLYVLFLVMGLLIITVAIVQGYRHKKWTVGGIWQTLKDRKYDMESRMKYQHDKWRYF